jgi:hypothetical protein
MHFVFFTRTRRIIQNDYIYIYIFQKMNIYNASSNIYVYIVLNKYKFYFLNTVYIEIYNVYKTLK